MNMNRSHVISFHYHIIAPPGVYERSQACVLSDVYNETKQILNDRPSTEQLRIIKVKCWTKGMPHVQWLISNVFPSLIVFLQLSR